VHGREKKNQTKKELSTAMKENNAVDWNAIETDTDR
jgi:hypothetical protein